jgi:hypothetical protein
MVRVYVGAAIGAAIGILAFAIDEATRHPAHDPIVLLFIVTVVPPAILGAVIGGFHAVMIQLRALRRQRALDMDDDEPDEPPTGIRKF